MRIYSIENSEEPNTKSNTAATCSCFCGFIISVTQSNKAIEQKGVRACFENGKPSIISKLLMLYNITLLS